MSEIQPIKLIKADSGAIILAAGYSSRMGSFKPLLRLGDATVIERVIDSFQTAGVKHIVVVLGHRADHLLGICYDRAVQTVLNRDFQSGMFSSVTTGTAALNEAVSSFFVSPADIPLIRPWTISYLWQSRQEGNEKILYPTYENRRGHPPLIPISLADRILEYKGEGGLRSVLANYPHRNVPVADEGILYDMDRPTDYEKVYKRWQRLNIPTIDEASAILKIRGVSEQVVDHSRMVMLIAQIIVRGLAENGAVLDEELTLSSALLHDLAKGRPDHARVGAEILSSMGFDPAAQIVAAHTELEINDTDPISEKEIVHLADKLIKGNEFIRLEKRFDISRKKYLNNPDALAAIDRRENTARRIKIRIENRTGRSINEMLRPLSSK